MPGKKPLTVLLASAATIAALAGCGSSGIKGTLTPDEANQLLADLTAVQDAAARGDCSAAASKAREFKSAVDGLPATAGTELKDALRGAGDQLVTLASDPSKCNPSGATGASGSQPASSSSTPTTTPPPDTNSTTSSTSTTSTKEPPPPPGGGGNPDGGGNGSGGGGGGGPPTGGTGGGTGGTGAGGGG
jgi:hypothetical protein